jgi:plasmid stabilization system protein ParE
MTLPVVFRRRFQDYLGAGFDWYEEQRSGLGEEFLSAVQSTLRSIAQFPEMFVFIHRDVRRAIVSRFPFAVVVLRVLHTARDPKIWPRIGRRAR